MFVRWRPEHRFGAVHVSQRNCRSLSALLTTSVHTQDLVITHPSPADGAFLCCACAVKQTLELCLSLSLQLCLPTACSGSRPQAHIVCVVFPPERVCVCVCVSSGAGVTTWRAWAMCSCTSCAAACLGRACRQPPRSRSTRRLARRR